MNSNILKRGLSGSLLSLVMFAGLSPAHAENYQLWREQVQITSSETVKLRESGRQATAPGYTLWREQVNRVANEGLPLYVATSRSDRSATPEDLFWREQVKVSARQGSRELASSK